MTDMYAFDRGTGRCYGPFPVDRPLRFERMKPSEYLLARAEALHEGRELPKALDTDWAKYVQLVMPDADDLDEWGGWDVDTRVLRLCLAAAIAADNES